MPKPINYQGSLTDKDGNPITTEVPVKFSIFQNYPNPFNPETWIPYQLAESGDVNIAIYNSQGQLIRVLHLGKKNVGIYMTKDKAAYWDGKDSLSEKVASGLYFYILQVGEVIPSIGAGDFRATGKMVIVPTPMEFYSTGSFLRENP